MGMGVWLGPMEGPAWERWNLHCRACATLERRGKTELSRQLHAGKTFLEACGEVDRLHPFPPSDAPEAELLALAEAYPAAVDEYNALMAQIEAEGR